MFELESEFGKTVRVLYGRLFSFHAGRRSSLLSESGRKGDLADREGGD